MRAQNSSIGFKLSPGHPFFNLFKMAAVVLAIAWALATESVSVIAVVGKFPNCVRV